MSATVTLADQIACIKREIALRETGHPSSEIGRELAVLEAVLGTLLALKPTEQTAGQPSPAPWNLMASSEPSRNGLFHLYLIDSDHRKIAALWGTQDEKLANGELICAARNDIREGEP